MEDRRIREILIEKNCDFKKLFIAHQEQEEKLKQISTRDFLSNQEIMEVKSLKKEKLRLKDKMQQFIFDYKQRTIQ